MPGDPNKIPDHQFGAPVSGDNNIASLNPFGRRLTNSRPLLSWFSMIWEHRHDLGYLWRILTHGVCDGCSMGPIGLRDTTGTGLHMCPGRVANLKQHARPAILKGDVDNIAFLRSLTEGELQMLGRISQPLIYRTGSRGFSRVSWDAALDVISQSLQGTSPERMGWLASASEESNESYYTFGKAARLLSTNNIDICSQFSYASLIGGIQHTTGLDTGTCSIQDVINTDLILVWGADLRSHQPAIAKYLIEAKANGARVVVFDSRLPRNMEQAWEASSILSALFGSRLVDDFIQINTGGESACISGILKHILTMKGQHTAYINAHTHGFSRLSTTTSEFSWRDLERYSGASRREMEWVAELFVRANSCVSLYSTGFVKQSHGTNGVESVVNLHLSRGMIGRPNCGILPIGPYRNMMGATDCGVSSTTFPGARPVTPASAAEMSALWGANIPSSVGLNTAAILEAAQQGNIDFLYLMGGNLLSASPRPKTMSITLSNVSMRVHQGTSFNPSMLLEPGEVTVILPTQNRYEQRGGGTHTSVDRRIRLSPEIEDHARIHEARPSWQIPCQIAVRARPEIAHALGYAGAQDIRNEMGRTIPRYAGIEALGPNRRELQWGEVQRGSQGFQNMPNARAIFTVIEPSGPDQQPGEWRLIPLWTESSENVLPQIWMDHDVEPGRDELYMHADDIECLDLEDGAHVRVYNDHGEWHARVFSRAIKPGMIQAHWPECQAVIPSAINMQSNDSQGAVSVRIESR
ncbi:MAG: molybdopterin-dependent oxidoreductase [Myxococcota bacterium]